MGRQFFDRKRLQHDQAGSQLQRLPGALISVDLLEIRPRQGQNNRSLRLATVNSVYGCKAAADGGVFLIRPLVEPRMGHRVAGRTSPDIASHLTPAEGLVPGRKSRTVYTAQSPPIQIGVPRRRRFISPRKTTLATSPASRGTRMEERGSRIDRCSDFISNLRSSIFNLQL